METHPASERAGRFHLHPASLRPAPSRLAVGGFGWHCCRTWTRWKCSMRVCLRKGINEQALAFAQEKGMPMLAGSDAHSLVELGLASVELPDFNSADELRAAVQSAQLSGRLLSVKDHFFASSKIAFGRLMQILKKTL